MRQVRDVCLVIALIVAVLPRLAWAQDPLETETARFLPQGVFKIVDTVEYQRSSEGVEVAVPLQFEVGILDHLEFMAEPVVYASIRPKSGSRADGAGDTELTLGYLFLEERDVWPAMALNVEIKIPTTKNPLIGTGKTDYTLTFVASKRIGDVDVHLNVGYSVLGSPPGTSLDNTFNAALAVTYPVGEAFVLVGELLAVTSSGVGAESAVAPEAGGGEYSGFLGLRWLVRPGVVLSGGLGYDNNQALLVRLGLSVRF